MVEPWQNSLSFFEAIRFNDLDHRVLQRDLQRFGNYAINNGFDQEYLKNLIKY